MLAAGVCSLAGASVASGAAHAKASAVEGKLHLQKSPLAAETSTSQAHWVCPEGACEAIAAPRPHSTAAGFALPRSGRLLEGSGELGGYDPADLSSAYDIPAGGGSGQTIAVIEAYGYPRAESDLAVYRAKYGLPPCTSKDGCFEKVNEQGEQASYPAEEPEWDGEAALDEDMASAACPECHILMVEGTTELPADLGESVNTAAKLGETEISNSYAYRERLLRYCGLTGCTRYDKDYEHPRGR